MRRVYTDGSCLGNPGPGGWAYVSGDVEVSGHEGQTTNNRMEMTAAISAMRDIAQSDVAIVSDSKYVVDCINKAWYKRWQRNGWKTSKKKDVLNRDLWEAMLEQLQARQEAGFKVTFEWTKGHAGQAENERADRLARRAADGPVEKVVSPRDES